MELHSDLGDGDCCEPGFEKEPGGECKLSTPVVRAKNLRVARIRNAKLQCVNRIAFAANPLGILFVQELA